MSQSDYIEVINKVYSKFHFVKIRIDSNTPKEIQVRYEWIYDGEYRCRMSILFKSDDNEKTLNEFESHIIDRVSTIYSYGDFTEEQLSLLWRIK